MYEGLYVHMVLVCAYACMSVCTYIYKHVWCYITEGRNTGRKKRRCNGPEPSLADIEGVSFIAKAVVSVTRDYTAELTYLKLDTIGNS